MIAIAKDIIGMGSPEIVCMCKKFAFRKKGSTELLLLLLYDEDYHQFGEAPCALIYSSHFTWLLTREAGNHASVNWLPLDVLYYVFTCVCSTLHDKKHITFSVSFLLRLLPHMQVLSFFVTCFLFAYDGLGFFIVFQNIKTHHVNVSAGAKIFGLFLYKVNHFFLNVDTFNYLF